MLLFEVNESYHIANKGLILTPGLGNKVNQVTVGTKILLKLPNKVEVQTSIIGIGFEGNHDILIPFLETIDTIPEGTEVWKA